MLTELHVRDLALVEEVWLEFRDGLTVLTGETGAGKTVLVSALKLLLGERADSAMVRQGAEEALVEGRFIIDGAEVIVKRRLTAEGRSRCTIDGEMATVTMLSELLGAHVDLHGQHEHQALLSPSRHAGYLDRFIGDDAEGALDAYHAAWRGALDARARLSELETVLADRDRRSEYLRFKVTDIDAVAPRVGEKEELEARLPRLRHGERLTEAAGGAWAALKEEDGASDRVSSALAALRAASGLDPALDELGTTLGELDIGLQEVAGSLRDYVESVEHDSDALEEAERRLQQLSDLVKKYGPTVEEAIAAREEASRELAMLEEGEAGLDRARADVLAAEEALRSAGASFVAVRDAAVGPFTDRLAAAAAELALPHAAFAVARTPLSFGAWTSEGPERVEFLFASGAGETPRPLAKVASGGEVSRVMLALKSVLGAADAVPVLVFDEVDAGIGGATASAVGRRLASLASTHQVLVVTHLAQVAAFADAHVVVERAESDARTVTTAKTVAGEDVVLEIARMLSGGSSSAGVAHARELLDSVSVTGAAKG